MQSPASTLFVYDGPQIVLQFEDADADGGLFSYALVDRYLWGPGIDHLLAARDLTVGPTYWTLPDHQGRIEKGTFYFLLTSGSFSGRLAACLGQRELRLAGFVTMC
ncbi:MAG: hypothetical protein KDA60_18765 [Planctomycetales bacterium]|nr:hypothetical protein [Planctomycetales bacterium]